LITNVSLHQGSRLKRNAEGNLENIFTNRLRTMFSIKYKSEMKNCSLPAMDETKMSDIKML